MTYQKLKDLRYLGFEKKRLERKLRELRSDMGSLCSPSLSGMPSAPGRLSQPERETEKFDETKRRYEERLKVYSAELLEAQQYIDGIDDTEMTPLTTNIDLILGGHSHSFFKELQYLDDKNGRPVPNDQNGKSGLYVGKIVMKLK